jgi:hypothetical protein
MCIVPYFDVAEKT